MGAILILPGIPSCLGGPTQPRWWQRPPSPWKHPGILVYTSKFSNLYYGIFQTKPEDKPKTLMKLVCVGIDEKVVGMHVLGMGSNEMMQGFGVAMKMGCT